MTSRRNFIRLAGIGAVTASMPVMPSIAEAAAPPVQSKELFELGVAGYSFFGYKGDLDKDIEILKAVNIKYVTLKDFQLPYNCTKEEADQVMGKFRAAGIEPYGLGVIDMTNEKQVDDAIAYATRAGVKMIIGAPRANVLQYLESKIKATDIRVAIHNHGPEDKTFPDIDSIYEKIKNMDKKMGICLDIGHSFRCGHNPTEMYSKFKDRVYDIHFKDVDEPVAKGKTVVNGWGKIDFIPFVKALRKAKYSGKCSLEFELKNPDLGIAESLGHFRGVLYAVK
jgi:inosose dehydratase